MLRAANVRPVSAVVAGAIALAMLAVPGAAAQHTEAPARIDSDTTWTVAESPYLLAGEVRVGRRATLTIEAGVEVAAEPEAQLVVAGAVRVEGDPAAGGGVVFRPATRRARWRGIALLPGGDGRSAIDGATMRGAAAALTVSGGGVDVRSSRFVRNRTGIRIDNPAAAVAVSGNTFVHNARAVAGRSRHDVTITLNDFWDNDVNLEARPQRPYDCGRDAARWSLNFNDILRGPGTPFFSHDVRTPPGSVTSRYVVDASDNWWGTSDPQRVRGRVSDGDTGATDGNPKPVRWDPPSEAPYTEWAPPGPVDDPAPEPSSVSDQGTLSFVDAPVHGRCSEAGSLSASGRATGVLRRLTEVRLSLSRQRAGGGCAWWAGRSTGLRRGRCDQPVWFEPRGLDRWSYDFGGALPPGRYRLRSRSNAEDVFEPARNDVRFRITSR